ncbi:regulator of G-protein signaling 2-like isoform X2 [Phyllopteryx taeniolatus]|uniref:regulator of G-protein signaling 2-like isoform X2 n=1 Tax=Phyllopteryx taeniolatus TaxID=161469 RepID=UPI002AD35EFC|nr:regulator of G-protein signaling 2-like isoform X2 [Phyllopteryx taeniolatus]
MDGLCKTSLDLQTPKRIHNAWKTKIHVFIQNPSPWAKINSHTASETRPVAESLEVLLSHKVGQSAFRDFLKSEFCEENLDFWLACQEFKTLDRADQRKQRALHIYEEFIGTESPSQVNLDFYTKAVIRQNLQQPSPSCFVVAQKKIYSLLENGPFPRFVQSKHFQDVFKCTSERANTRRL